MRLFGPRASTVLPPVLLMLAFATLAAAAFWHHFSGPSDGAWLEPGQRSWLREGLAVSPLVARPGGLLPGDVVTAVDGRSAEDWAESLFAPGAPRPRWRIGQTVTYELLRGGAPQTLAIRLGAYPVAAFLAKSWSLILFVGFSQLVMTFVFLRRPAERGARMLFIWAWSLVHTYLWMQGLQVGDVVQGTGFWLLKAAGTIPWLVFWSANLAFTLVFPNEQPVVLRRPWLIPFVFAAPFGFHAVFLLATRLLRPNTLEWIGTWIVANWIVGCVSLALSIFIVARTFRLSRQPAVRRKIRWLVFGAVLCGGSGLALWLMPGIVLGQPLISPSALGLVLLPFPLFMAVAVLRDRLFDIDVIIRRTLVYSLLTGLLALAYFAGVVVLQFVFRIVSGEGQSQVVTVLSTLAIAALFVPLRARVQTFIDQRFYRSRYDAAQTLAGFAAAARDETDLDTLAGRLVEVVDETMQPEQVSVWLKPLAEAAGPAPHRYPASTRQSAERPA